MKSASTLSRRRFLLAAGAGSVATAAVVATKTKPAAAGDEAQSSEQRKGLPRDGSHPEVLYNTAKV
jgi:hypothetical protein